MDQKWHNQKIINGFLIENLFLPFQKFNTVRNMKDLKLLAEGLTAQVFDWKENTVLKLFFEGFPEKPVNVEYDRNIVIRDFDIPAPKLIERIEYKGRIGLVFEKLQGDTLLKHILKKKFLFLKYANIMSKLHNKIHKIDIPNLPSVHEYLRKDIEYTNDLSNELKKNIINYLNTLETDTKLCHFDFHPDQIMLTNNGPYLIDWMNASSGSPNSDVARTYLMFLTYQYSNSEFNFEKLMDFKVNILFRAYFKKYTRINSEITKEEVYRWLLPIAAGRLSEDIEHEKSFLLKMINYLFEELKIIK